MVTVRNEYTIQPHVGVGKLRFGMSKEEVHGILGRPSWHELPNEFSSMTREEFDAHHCFVDFQPDGHCCGVEFYPEVRVKLDEQDLMAMSYNELVQRLRSRQVRVVEEGDGARCDDLGIACWAPKLGDPERSDAPIESLMVYQRGYYDESDAFIAKLNLKSQ